MKKYNKEIYLPDEMIGKRLDVVLAEMLPEFSRSRIKKWIIDGSIKIDQEKKNYFQLDCRRPVYQLVVFVLKKKKKIR